jgi:hypothetical protein
MIKVSLPNFSRKHPDWLECRCGCGSFNYSEKFLICLQALRFLYGKPMTVTCGCRCIKHNSSPEVGGVEKSLHECETKKASAADVTSPYLEELYKLACSCGMFNEAIWYKKKRFIHLGQDPNQDGNYYEVKY